LAELRLLRSAEARPLVEEYLERATDEDLCRLAESISAALGG
jgi:hypothetical protein